MAQYRVLLMNYKNSKTYTNGIVKDEYIVEADTFTDAQAQANARSPESKIGDCLFVTWDKGNTVIR